MKMCFSLLFLILFPVFALAQDDGFVETVKAQVLKIISQEKIEIEGSEATGYVQRIEVKILSGNRQGEVLTFENDRLKLDVGDRFYFDYFKFEDGSEYFAVLNRDRRTSVLVLIGFFVFVVLLFGKIQGLKSLLSLIAGMFVIFYVLIPGILDGINPMLLSFLVSAGILFFAIYFTHGFNKESHVAYFGTMISIIITTVFAIFSVYITKLSGFESEESVFLNLISDKNLDFPGILLGSIIIGTLGVLDDISVTQAAVVTELYSSNDKLSAKEVYKRAMRVGREHVSALVNTMVLAYTGVSLPIILYFHLSPLGISSVFDLEIFVVEIVRMIVSSFGLILTVPIVTFLAVKYLKNYKPKYSNSNHIHHSK